jgi:ArsR family transcriptional regulator, virulence genes transcriptional regulator
MSDEDFYAMQEQAQNAAQFLKSLAHPIRLMIACSLIDIEISAGALHQQFSQLSQSAFSQHLAVLRKNDIVSTRRESQVIYYSLKNHDVIKIVSTLKSIYC